MKRTILGAISLVPLAAVLFSPGVGGVRAADDAKTRPAFVNPLKYSTQQITENMNGFAWQMFLFVNWPELPGYRGVPDEHRSIGDAGPTMWESFKNVSEVYQTNGQRPVDWEIDDELPTSTTQAAAISKTALAALGTVDSNWIHFLAEPTMIDGQQICDEESQVVRYDVRGNRPYFDYVVNNLSGHQLYNVEGQQAALADGTFAFNFPSDTLEVKASWRILSAQDDASRYWTAVGVYWDSHQVLRSAKIGLTGLHIISKALPNWIWITFEQVDNPTATYRYFLGQKGAALGRNPNYDTNLNGVNQFYQGALTGTKWQYYELMKVQTDYVDGQGQPILMSNTQMETYFQQQSSCISCHNLASIGNPQNSSQNLRLQPFYPLNPYVGTTNFQQIANQQFPGESFKAMDFVWSLRNAHWLNPPANAAVLGKVMQPARKPVAKPATEKVAH